MDKIKNFILRYKVTLTIIVLLGISFTVYFLASAEDDPDANKFEVTYGNVTITDGTPNVDGNFDENDEPGNDSSDSNHIVRNFDSITYNIEYKLIKKEEQETTSESREVTVEVMFPKNDFSATVGFASTLEGIQQNTIKIDGNEYYYYQYSFKEINPNNDNSMAIILSNINSTNGKKVKPIIRIFESTDNTVSKLENNGEYELDNITNKLDVTEVTVSAVSKLSAKLYPGTKKVNEENSAISTIPVGILLYIPKDENKGIKGIEIPETAKYTMEVAGENRTITFNKAGTTSDYSILNLPESYKESNATLKSENDTSPYYLTFEHIKYNENVIDDLQYVSSNVFIVNSDRGASKNDANIIFTLKDETGKELSTTNVLDNYSKIIGKYETKIDFTKNETTSSDNKNYFDSGLAIYNTGEEFEIVDTITYFGSGDSLENGFTNYIKVDNSAIKIIPSDLKEQKNITIEYGIGEWNKDNFEKTSDAPAYCKNFSNLSKEDLINYYGGPCIEEKTGKEIKWINSTDPIDDNDNNKIILVKYTYDSEYKPQTTTMIRLKAKILETSSIGTTHQVVARGTTTVNGEVYYLSNTEENGFISADKQKSDPLAYAKTIYPLSGTVVNEPKDKHGNTLYVTPFRVSNNVEIKDKYDTSKTTIYSGFTDPISINIKPILQNHDGNKNFSLVKLNICLPEELKIVEEMGDTDLGEGIINGSNYYCYTYEYSEEELSNYKVDGILNDIKLHAKINSLEKMAERTILVNIEATKVINNIEYSSLNYQMLNTNTETKITLINNNDINIFGELTSPTYFEKNGEMIYNMKATNISKSDAKLSLLKVIPYNGSNLGEGINFSGSISVSLKETLPVGYKAYYTKDDSKTILNNEFSENSLVDWKEWTNPTKSISGVTAIKIVAQNNIPAKGYFAGEEGISLIMKTSGNQEGDVYYNNFYILRSDENGQIDYKIASDAIYSSVYNRSISGYVFEDYDVNGFYSVDENRISDVPVSLYKIESEDETIDLNNDKLVDETITDKNGYYKFKGLSQGNYYVKFDYDCDKYTVTTQNAKDSSLGNTTDIDSDVSSIEGACGAISKVLSLENDSKTINQKHIDAGLRLKQNFGVNIKKYITNVVVNSNRGTESYDYNNETKVKIDVRNMKNTTFRVTYGFEIENSKYFPGTIGSIIETIPEGMTFDSSLEENDGWYESDGQLYYTKLDGTLIYPNQKYYMKVVLDLKTDDGGTFVNLISVQDLKPMEYNTGREYEGIEIKDDEGNTIDFDSEEENDSE